MPPRYPRVAAAIRSTRRRKPHSQEQAARIVGVTRFHWIRWEQGLHMPDEEHQAALVLYGVPASVFDDEDESEAQRAAQLYWAVKGVLTT